MDSAVKVKMTKALLSLYIRNLPTDASNNILRNIREKKRNIGVQCDRLMAVQWRSEGGFNPR